MATATFPQKQHDLEQIVYVKLNDIQIKLETDSYVNSKGEFQLFVTIVNKEGNETIQPLRGVLTKK